MLGPWGQPWPPWLGEEWVSISEQFLSGAAVLHPDTNTIT